MESLLNWYSVL